MLIIVLLMQILFGAVTWQLDLEDDEVSALLLPISFARTLVCEYIFPHSAAIDKIDVNYQKIG